MPQRLLSFLPTPLRIVDVASEADGITMLTVPRSAPALCPDCQLPSDRTHGYYDRVLTDLPWQGRPVRLRLRLRRFRCRNPACHRRTFSESVPEVAAPRARRSRRLQDVQHHLGLALGGSPAARLAQRLAMPASPSTFLRMVRAGATPAPTSPRVVGIDEWAWRRGRCYGTIIVDLERNTVVDLLPGREAGQVADWLKLHPDVEIITRDRADVYGEGARQGAPDAMQVLDRWHLLRNVKQR